METLFKKNVLIVGGTGGIGREVARLIKGSSANVFVTSQNQAKLDSLVNDLGLSASNAFLMDITNPKEVEKVAANIHDQLGKALDIVINAAGIGIIKPLDKMSYDDFDKSIDINLKGTFYLFKSFLPPMKVEKQGLIINIPGVLGKTSMNGASAYSASKYGVNGLTKSIREELKRTNIRITNLYLGGVDTPFWDEIDMRVQKNKFIQAKEAAKSIWFLCQQPRSGVVSEMVIQPFNHQAI